jgi:hypothetical protein
MSSYCSCCAAIALMGFRVLQRHGGHMLTGATAQGLAQQASTDLMSHLISCHTCRDEEWRTLRLAWQPAFQSGSLEGYCDLMDSCATQLAERLKKLGESGQVVEMWRELGRMTLQVVRDAYQPATAASTDNSTFGCSSLLQVCLLTCQLRQCPGVPMPRRCCLLQLHCAHVHLC